jgi:mannose-6-phosphate isomerase-like protein (cupin superfamily)
MFKIEPFPQYQSGLPNAPFPSLDIPTMIENLKHERTWEKGELSSIILLKSPGMKIMLTVLHEGTEVMSFQANDSATFQVIEGKLMVHIKKESFPLNKGELLTLDEKIKYSFDSVEETVLLLTLISGNLQQKDREKEITIRK